MTLQVGTTKDDTQFLRSKSGGFDFHITEQKVTWNATLHYGGTQRGLGNNSILDCIHRITFEISNVKDTVCNISAFKYLSTTRP